MLACGTISYIITNITFSQVVRSEAWLQRTILHMSTLLARIYGDGLPDPSLFSIPVLSDVKLSSSNDPNGESSIRAEATGSKSRTALEQGAGVGSEEIIPLNVGKPSGPGVTLARVRTALLLAAVAIVEHCREIFRTSPTDNAQLSDSSEGSKSMYRVLRLLHDWILASAEHPLASVSDLGRAALDRLLRIHSQGNGLDNFMTRNNDFFQSLENSFMSRMHALPRVLRGGKGNQSLLIWQLLIGYSKLLGCEQELSSHGKNNTDRKKQGKLLSFQCLINHLHLINKTLYTFH